MGAEKYDIRKAHKALYTAPAHDFVEVDVPQMQFLAVDGHGDPNTSKSYSDAIEALYSVAYALKFDSKKNLGRDFVVAPLEGTWRADDMAAFTARDKAAWSWTMMISQPEWVTSEMFDAAVEKISAKKAREKKEGACGTSAPHTHPAHRGRRSADLARRTVRRRRPDARPVARRVLAVARFGAKH